MGEIYIDVIVMISQAVLSVMKQRNVSVNVQTFGCLALGCERQKDGLQLLKDMEVMYHTSKLFLAAQNGQLVK